MLQRDGGGRALPTGNPASCAARRGRCEVGSRGRGGGGTVVVLAVPRMRFGVRVDVIAPYTGPGAGASASVSTSHASALSSGGCSDESGRSRNRTLRCISLLRSGGAGLSVGWMSCWTRSVWGGRHPARCGMDVTSHHHWCRLVGRIGYHDRCLLTLVLVSVIMTGVY